MVVDPQQLPDDVEALKRMIIVMATDMSRFRVENEKLKAELAKHRRARFGQSSEQRDARGEQLELAIEALEETQAEALARLPAAIADMVEEQAAAQKPARRALPGRLPLIEVRAPDRCACPKCGSGLRKISEEMSQSLDYVPGYFRRQHLIRPVFSCRACDSVVQDLAPAHTIARGRATPALLAHILVSKFDDHLPLYRQAEIAERQGVELASSTLCGWVGASAVAVEPLVEAMAADLMASPYLHADDTPIPVLAPGAGKTKEGRFWVYVRDERGWGGSRAPLALYHYAPDRKSARPQTHLSAFSGVMHADGYGGFDALYATGRICEAACWAHVRRNFIEEEARSKSSIAAEAIERIGQLYGVERAIKGAPPDERLRRRQTEAAPIADALKLWSEMQVARLSQKSDLAKAFKYMLRRWRALTRYLEDGHVEIDNNPVERAIRGSALGRKNHLFMGSDKGGERAAIFYTLIETCRLNGVNSYAYLADVLARIHDHPNKAIADLFPWNWRPADRAIAA